MPRRALPRCAEEPDVASLASVLADASRTAMLDHLLDGAAHSIGELARLAGVSPSTASSHLNRLVDARLVATVRVGRERRVRLAGPEIAEVLERLAVLAAPQTSSRAIAPSRAARLRFARTCYDHLAGFLGVTVRAALVDRGWLYATSDTFEPTPALFEWLAGLGHPVAIDGSSRPLTRACLDWSERVPHVAGRIGAAIAAVFVDHGWVVPIRDTRALRLTVRGRKALARELAVAFPA